MKLQQIKHFNGANHLIIPHKKSAQHQILPHLVQLLIVQVKIMLKRNILRKKNAWVLNIFDKTEEEKRRLDSLFKIHL